MDMRDHKEDWKVLFIGRSKDGAGVEMGDLSECGFLYFSEFWNMTIFTYLNNKIKERKKRRLSTEELMLLNCGAEEDAWESLQLQ